MTSGACASLSKYVYSIQKLVSPSVATRIFTLSFGYVALRFLQCHRVTNRRMQDCGYPSDVAAALEEMEPIIHVDESGGTS